MKQWFKKPLLHLKWMLYNGVVTLAKLVSGSSKPTPAVLGKLEDIQTLSLVYM